MTSPSADARDYEHMARALRLARRGLYNTKPNPAVGCVIVNGGEIVGEGWTRPVGGPHAERVALAAAGARARGATAYVTLEPCNHFGRTEPCTDRLIEAGIARVVCAMVDPNPLTGGAGIARLEAAGIAVDVGALGAPAEALIRGHVSRMTRKRPWVRLKLAASLDGRTALADGASRWITGPVARRDVHRFRACAGAVLTGIGTILADDPLLTARLEDLPAGGGEAPAPAGGGAGSTPAGRAGSVGEASGAAAGVVQPLRVILDSALRTPPAARTLTAPGQVVVFTARARAQGQAHRHLAAAGACIESVPAAPRCDLPAVLARLGELEVNDVWVEAGPVLSGALLEAGLIDELVVYLAPHVLGAGARGMFATAPLASLAERHALVLEEIRKLGPDLRITARPSTVASP